MKKLIIVLITISVLLIPINVKASAPALPINPGISPSIMSEAEFATWLFTLFGVRSHNTTNIYDTDYLEYLQEQAPDLDLNEIKKIYNDSYLHHYYKVVIPKNTFKQLGQAIGSSFALASALNVKVTLPDGEGAYNADYTIDKLNDNFLLNYNGLKSYTMFTDIYVNYANRINSIYAFNTPYSSFDSTTIVFTLDSNWTLTNDGNINYDAASFQSDWLMFVCNIQSGGVVGTSLQPKSKYDTLTVPKDGTIEIGKGNYIDGIVSINPDFTQALIDGAYSLVTPYTTDVEADTIEVAIPNDVAGILDGVTDGTISTTQAIEESKAIPVDTTSSAAVTGAIAAVTPLTAPTEFQTYGLADLFPFCIPFDVINFFRAFNDTPKTPEFDIKLPNGQSINGKIQYNTYHVDLHDFDGVANIVRKIEVVAFCILLCSITRSRMIRS